MKCNCFTLCRIFLYVIFIVPRVCRYYILYSNVPTRHWGFPIPLINGVQWPFNISFPNTELIYSQMHSVVMAIQMISETGREYWSELSWLYNTCGQLPRFSITAGLPAQISRDLVVGASQSVLLSFSRTESKSSVRFRIHFNQRLNEAEHLGYCAVGKGNSVATIGTF